MFNKLRNKVFFIYLISIILILLSSLTFVYFKTRSEMIHSIEMRLETGEEPKVNEPREKPVEELSSIASFQIEPEVNEFEITDSPNALSLLEEKLGSEITVDTDNNTITSENKTYMYRLNGEVYKIIDITYDIEYLNSLVRTLVLIGFLATVVFSIFGFILISKLIKPIKESYERQNSFVSDASHELKTPLSVIKTCLSLIANSNDENNEMVEYCQEETDRLIRLTNNLLQLSENDDTEYDLINLSTPLKLMTSSLEASLFEEGINFTSEIEENLEAKVATDDIKQLVHILIDNGVKYNDKRNNLDLKVSKSTRNITITVRNSSDHISKAELENIFDRFYRIDKSRSEKGFGLGLSLAKHITNKYHGTIKADYHSGYFTMSVKIPL